MTRDARARACYSSIFHYPLYYLQTCHEWVKRYFHIQDTTGFHKKILQLFVPLHLQDEITRYKNVIVNFWADEDGTRSNSNPLFADLAREYQRVGVTEFARANTHDVREQALEYCI